MLLVRWLRSELGGRRTGVVLRFSGDTGLRPGVPSGPAMLRRGIVRGRVSMWVFGVLGGRIARAELGRDGVGAAPREDCGREIDDGGRAIDDGGRSSVSARLERPESADRGRAVALCGRASLIGMTRESGPKTPLSGVVAKYCTLVSIHSPIDGAVVLAAASAVADKLEACKSASLAVHPARVAEDADEVASFESD